jgi:hypothetical protein
MVVTPSKIYYCGYKSNPSCALRQMTNISNSVNFVTVLLNPQKSWGGPSPTAGVRPYYSTALIFRLFMYAANSAVPLLGQQELCWRSRLPGVFRRSM